MEKAIKAMAFFGSIGAMAWIVIPGICNIFADVRDEDWHICALLLMLIAGVVFVLVGGFQMGRWYERKEGMYGRYR